MSARSRSPILVALFSLSCCFNDVNTRLLPREDGSVSAVSVAREESAAASQNVVEANRHCEGQGRRAVFGDEQTEYQGVLTKRGGAIARVAKAIPGVGGQLTSDEDYRVTTSFKCVATE